MQTFSYVWPCRTAWVQKIKAASELFIETEKKKREKAYLGAPFVVLSKKMKMSPPLDGTRAD